jgi:site-specific recombinase XerD
MRGAVGWLDAVGPWLEHPDRLERDRVDRSPRSKAGPGKAAAMGFSRRRRGKDGRPRYTAYHRDLRGREASAGTFARKADADAAWQAAEVNARAGLRHDPGRGRQTFQHYAEAVWLPNHRMELSTRADYTSAIYRHIMWFFGPMKMRDIGPAQVREWITALKARGVSPRRIEYSKNSVLGAIFTTALEDGVIAAHPSHRVATDPVPRKPRAIITAAQFDALYAALIAVSRKHHPAGRRFWVKNYPKDRQYRQLRMSDQIVRKLSEHMTAHDLGADDLLFARRGNRGPGARPTVQPDPETLGWTEPGHAGRRYRHGTTTAYGLGRCRCQRCRHAVASYRAQRRRSGNDRPAKVQAVEDGDPHINASTFRTSVLQPAFRAAGVERGTMHGLRHAHASWLLAGGADLQVVKERLGHAKISTTEGYLHTSRMPTRPPWPRSTRSAGAPRTMTTANLKPPGMRSRSSSPHWSA